MVLRETWIKSSKGIGIAVCNFRKHDIPHAIDLKIGDKVVIEQQCHGWYLGYLFNNRDVSGIFPSAYVHIKQPSKRISQSSNRDSGLILEEDAEQVVEELTETLKEWNKAMKRHFVTSSIEMMMVRAAIQAETPKLLSLRTAFTSPYLTHKQRTQLRSDITQKIDWGNKKLGLDVVPRVDGMQVNPDSMSPAELYQIHDLASIYQSGTTSTISRGTTHKRSPNLQYNSHHMYMQLKSLVFSSDITDELVMYFSLYNYNSGNGGDFISERVMCRIGRGGLIEGIESGEYFTAMFVDLTTADMNLDVYVTAHIYKLGGLRTKDGKKHSSNKNVVTYKRPYGCAAVALKDVLQHRMMNADADEEDIQLGKDFCMSVMFVRDKKDDDFSTITEHLIRRIRDRRMDDREFDMVNVTLGMFHGDIATVKQVYPQLFAKKIKITQKLGFADVIAPDELRNDFYLNLYEGDFDKGSKTAEKNVEAKVFVANGNGECLKCIYPAGGDEPEDSYTAAVFYHSNKPRWNEVIKVTLPDYAFRDCHIRIEFRHCSTQGAEKKLFAFSYLPLEDRAGTTIQDRQHNLYVYKSTIFRKGSSQHYLNLDFESNSCSGAAPKVSNQFCTVSPKETCFVRTTLCSTKLTQDINLVNFFRWHDSESATSLAECLRNVQQVKGDELMRHHTDFLNCLFHMTCDVDASQHQELIFQALIHILHFTKEKNYAQFLPMFELYIEKTFCAPLAHRELLNQIQNVLSNQVGPHNRILSNVIDVLDLLFKFIVRSATLYAEKRMDNDHHILSKGMDEFWKALQKVIENNKHQSYSAEIKINKMAVISRVVDVFPDLIMLLPADKLAKSFSAILSKIPKRDSDLGEHKLKCLSKLINSPLFEQEEARRIVLEVCNSQLEHCLQSHQDLKLAAQNLSDLLTAIYRHKDTMKQEIEAVLLKLMRVLCITIVDVESSDVVGLLTSCLITMLSMMDEALLTKILTKQKELKFVKEFLIDLFQILTDTITKAYIPSDWVVMLMVINSVILRSAQHFSQAISDRFIDESRFDERLWTDFFMLCIKFITQPCLQLENFSERKQTTLLAQYNGDMRLEMGTLLYEMWETLGEFGNNQCRFIPSLVGPFLEVALLPENKLRLSLIPIFYDMLMFKFDVVPGEIVDKLDALYTEGKGDRSFKSVFSKLILERADTDSSGRRDKIVHFVDSVSTLIDRLMDYRMVMAERCDHMNTLMLCTVNLLEFYENNIERENLRSYYIDKLTELNVAMQCYTEAGFTLSLEASRLSWTHTHLRKIAGFPTQQEWERKEQQYLRIIDYFDKGESWENAIPLCKELADLYETKLYDYNKLTNILKRQAELYGKIFAGSQPEKTPRLAAKYYRIAFYGQSFPQCIRNKSFVYKASAFTGPAAVIEKLKTEYPNAELMKESIEQPDISQLHPNKQYLQSVIIEADPEVTELFPDALRPVDTKISSFYQWNNVQRFIYDKPYHHPCKDKDNEFKSLHKLRYVMRTVKPVPGMLHWCELQSMTQQVLQPIETAIESLSKKNREMRETVRTYRKDKGHDQQELSRMLSGTVDAKVNGGVVMYQKAFLTGNYDADCDLISSLKECVSEHMVIIKDGLELFKEIVKSDLRPLMATLHEEYKKLKVTLKDNDPAMDISSLHSTGSGSVLSVFEHLGTESPRASSGYSSSDVESHTTKPPTRKSTSVGNRESNLSTDQNGASPHPRRKEGQLVDEPRAGSIFYTQMPSDDILDGVMESENSNSSSSDEEEVGTLKREECSALAPPSLPPKKVRSSSLTILTPTLMSPDSPKQVNQSFDLSRRPLPKTPEQLTNSRPTSLPKRTKTFAGNANKPTVDYQIPRELAPPRPAPRAMPSPRGPVRPNDDDTTPPPLPHKSVLLRLKSIPPIADN